MLKITVFLLFAVATCYADTSTPITCGYLPSNTLKCLKNPVLFNKSPPICNQQVTECSKMTCLFRELDWFDGDKVNKKKVSDHFEQFANAHPAWRPAVNDVKTACLGTDLPAQGYFVGCPAYDIVLCISTSFIKEATPSQWLTTPECQYPRSFAAACPVCPTECFAPMVPIGSCNACVALPRSP